MISILKGLPRGTLAIPTTLVFFAILVASPARAYEHRKSTPSFGIQYGYGWMLKEESFHIPDWPIGGGETVPVDFKTTDVFNSYGSSLDVGIRFVLDRSHALGFGFDDIRYQRKDGFDSAQRPALPQLLKFTTVHADYYLYFRRRMQVSYYIAPFLGIQQKELRFKKSDIQSNEYRLLYGGGAGVEYFVTRSFSFDLTARIFAMKGQSSTTVTLQPALGFHIYVI